MRLSDARCSSASLPRSTWRRGSPKQRTRRSRHSTATNGLVAFLPRTLSTWSNSWRSAIRTCVLRLLHFRAGIGRAHFCAGSRTIKRGTGSGDAALGLRVVCLTGTTIADDLLALRSPALAPPWNVDDGGRRRL